MRTSQRTRAQSDTVGVRIPRRTYAQAARMAAHRGTTVGNQIADMLAWYEECGGPIEGAVVCDTPEDCLAVMDAIIQDATDAS